jgi:hypothetical protein
MHLLSPYFYLNLIRQRKKTYALPFGLFLSAYAIIHLYAGVDITSFLISNALFILTYFFTISFYHFVNGYDNLGKIFRQLLIFNAVLTALAIPFFFLPKSYQEIFWYINKLTKGVTEFPRLALFTYEASYYSLLLVPVIFYYLLKFFFNQIQHNKWLMLALVTVPMLLSMSFGVIGAIILTWLILSLVHLKKLYKKKRAFYITAGLILSVSLTAFIFWFYFPANPFVIRIGNILAGSDTSAKGRTTDSFTMAWRLANERSLYFGAGLGQIKILIIELVGKYYKYWGVFPRYDIPNAMGETLAIFGFTGIFIKLFLEVWLFFKTKVFSNYYRFSLFLFIFIYQFTGSFITNIIEYVIWALAFSSVFPFFNVTKQNHDTVKNS